MPIVVALLAGILGVAGVVVGQLLNARRERQHEEVRWERERQRLADERAHETRLHWSEKRAEAYGAYMAELDAWIRHARYVCQMPRTLPDKVRLAEMDRLTAVMQGLVGTIQLMAGNEDIRWKCTELVGYCQLFIAGAASLTQPEQVGQIVSDGIRVSEHRDKLFELFRAELGVGTPPASVESATPSPPSAPTS